MKSNHLMNQVEEDYERISDMDRMYLMERENELWEEYQEWCDEQDRLPAKVTITIEGKTNKRKIRREQNDTKRN